MSRPLNLAGKQFCYLTVISRSANDKHGNSMWECVCKCGTSVTVRGAHLTSGRTTSCGCREVETLVQRNRKHGMSQTRIYNIWCKMIARCSNPSVPAYIDYGAKGITVCTEWRDFQPFLSWAVSAGYNDTLSIDRINVFGNYEPSNCRWVDSFVQNNNTTRNMYIEIAGQAKSVNQWASETGLSHSTILARMKRGVSPETAVLTPAYGCRR